MTAPSLTDPASQGDQPWLATYPRDIDWAKPILPESMVALFDESVAKYGDRPFVDFMGRRWTYREIGRMVDRTAAGLRRQGVKAGTKVGLCLPNTPYFIASYFGVLKAGGTVVTFNPLYVSEELAHQVADSQTEIMITIDVAAIFPKIQPLLGQHQLRLIVNCCLADALPWPKSWLFKLAKRDQIARPAPDPRVISFDALQSDDPITAPTIDPTTTVAVLQYTGGTTGLPKGAMLSHANLSANVEQLDRWFNVERADQERVLCVLPFFHVFAMTVAMNIGVRWGAEMILLPRFEIKLLMETIKRRKPTFFPGVPTLFKAVLDYTRVTPVDLRSIRHCLSGGAGLPVELKQAFEAASGCVLLEGYGLSETSPVSTANPFDGIIKAGSIGLPMPNVHIEFRDLDDINQRAKPGQPGELCVRGPNVMMGYWGKPKETAATMVDGLLRTGDVGYFDEDGYIVLVDRIKDLIICSGYNVYPRVIEEAIYRHPDVVAVTVVGMPDPYRGEAPAAFVQLRPDATATSDELMSFLKDKLSPIEMPRLIEIRAELPKTMIGKLSKKELRAELLASAKGGSA